MKIFSARK